MHDQDNIFSVPNDNIQFIINGQLCLDTLLMEIREITILYSTYLLKEKKRLNKKNLNLEQNLTH